MNGYMELCADTYADFACKAGNCNCHCCRNWSIELTAKERETAVTLCAGKLPDNLFDSVGSGKTYTLKLREDGCCPLLTDDRLCGWQMRLGEEHLWEICRMFPRETNLVGKRIERSVSLSCEAAVEQLLGRTAPLKFQWSPATEIPSPAQINYHFSRVLLTDPLRTLYRPMRARVISILQDRRHPFAQRLFLLGAYGRILRRASETGKWDSAARVTTQFHCLLPRMPKTPRISQADLFVNRAALWQEVRQSFLPGLDTCAIWRDAAGRLCDSAPDRALWERGKSAFASYLEGRPTFLEHLAVSVCFNIGVPFAFAEGALPDRTDAFLALWASLEFALYAVCAEHPADDALIVAVVSGFFRDIGHYESCADFFHTHGKDFTCYHAFQ